jgi:hypothetical protein
MSEIIGLRTCAKLSASVAIASNATLGSAGTLFAQLNPTIAAGQSMKLRAWIPVTVGATGGVRVQVVVPAGGTLFNATFTLQNTVAPSTTTAAQVASAAFTSALANAGTHFIVIDAEIVNGATAGTVDIQVAQNTVDVLTLTVLRGAFVDVIKF